MGVWGSKLQRVWRRGFVGAREIAPVPLKELYRVFVPRTMSESFRDIYLLDAWGEGSGKGSTPDNTVAYREFLQEFLAAHGIRSVVDLGYGDWRFSCMIDWSGIEYLGIDAVPEVIDRNRREHGDRARFECRDVSSCELPRAELALVKDVLQHWPSDVIHSFVSRLSQYPYVLITNCSYDHAQLNGDIGMGGFRPLDLTREPFGLDLEEVLRFRTAEGANKQVLLMRGIDTRRAVEMDDVSADRAPDRSHRTAAAPARSG